MRVLAMLCVCAALAAAWTAECRADCGTADEATTKLFKAQCANCHGVDGKGKTTAGQKAGVKDWTDGKTLMALKDEQIRQLIREGKKGDDGKQKMPAFKKLTDAQVDALIAFVRSCQK